MTFYSRFIRNYIIAIIIVYLYVKKANLRRESNNHKQRGCKTKLMGTDINVGEVINCQTTSFR